MSFYRAPLTRVSPCLLYQPSPTSIKCLYTLVKSLWNLLFSRLNYPSSLSLLSPDRCSSILTALCPFPPVAPVCPCLSCTGPSTPNGVSPVLSAGEGAPCSNLLAVLLLVQRGMLLPSLLQGLPLLVQGELGVHQDPQGLHCRAAFQTLGLQSVQVPGVVPAHRQDMAFPFLEFHKVPLSISQGVKVPLESSTTI